MLPRIELQTVHATHHGCDDWSSYFHCSPCDREHMPGTGAQGIPQGTSHMPSIPFADPAAAASSSSAQQAGRPLQSAEMISSAPISMESVFTSSQVSLVSQVCFLTSSINVCWAGIPKLYASKLTSVTGKIGGCQGPECVTIDA